MTLQRYDFFRYTSKQNERKMRQIIYFLIYINRSNYYATDFNNFLTLIKFFDKDGSICRDTFHATREA